MNETDEIFSSLSSHRHSKRLEAFSLIEALTTLSSLQEFIIRTYEMNDNELYLIAINKLEKVALSSDIENASFAIQALNNFTFIENSSLSNLAKDAMEKFCIERKIPENYKNLCFRFATRKTDPERREYLFQLSTKYKFFATVHLIVDQLQFGDDSKKIEAIKSLVEFRDSRGIFYIRTLARSENVELARAAIESLSTIGTILDALWIAFFFERLPKEIAPAAFSSIRKISPLFALLFFKFKYKSSSSQVKIDILKECSLIKTATSLSFILNCFINENDPRVLLETLRSIYNIETTKKISTLITYFKKSPPEKRFHLINIISDFHDERCRLFYMKVIESDANFFVKRFSLEKLSRYRRPESLALFLKIANDPDHPLKNVALTSIFSEFSTKYKKKAFGIIAALPVDNFLHYKTLKSMISYIDETSFNDEVATYLINQFKTGVNSKIFMTLDVFKNNHNSDLFDLLVSEYGQPYTHDETFYLEETLQFILNSNPYYITPSYSNTNILGIIERLNFQQIDYRLLIHLCRLSISDDILFKITMAHKGLVGPRLENILMDKSLTFEEKRFITVYLIKSQSLLTMQTIETIKDQFFSYYPRDLKDSFISYLIKGNNSANFDFINFNVYLSPDESLRNEFYHFAGGLL
jgi:hypothetical protein